MNKIELKKLLGEMKFRQDAFYMDDGAPPSDTFVLEENYGRWFVYYSERGHRNDEREFDTEDKACHCLLEFLQNDPNTKIK